MPERAYSDYTRYRPLLRNDFQNRCAYCLTHEYFVGGEAGFEIDHFRPRNGSYARPDLIAEYRNLYWSCSECNSNKGDIWPSPDDEVNGICFIDPCTPDGDHDRNWLFLDTGDIRALTLAGEYTEEKLLLWRPLLVHRRAQQYSDQQEVESVRDNLRGKEIDPATRTLLLKRLAEVEERLTPPVYHRTRHADRPNHS